MGPARPAQVQHRDPGRPRVPLGASAEYWIDFGIDGWRLDVANEIDDDDFWREFRRRVQGGNPEAYIVGEVWDDASRWLQGDMWDAVMNYLFTPPASPSSSARHVDAANWCTASPLFPPRPTGAAAFANGDRAARPVPPPTINAVQLNLLDSHDMARFLTLARGDATALRLATLFQMTYPGAPSIYYGDEIGMEGGKEPASRAGFVWDPSEWDTDLRNYIKRAIALRHAHPCLRTGEYINLHSDGTVYALGRQLGEDRVLVAFNTGWGIAEASIPVGEFLPEDTPLFDAFKKYKCTVQNGQVEVRILPRSAVALEIAP